MLERRERNNPLEARIESFHGSLLRFLRDFGEVEAGELTCYGIYSEDFCSRTRNGNKRIKFVLETEPYPCQNSYEEEEIPDGQYLLLGFEKELFLSLGPKSALVLDGDKKRLRKAGEREITFFKKLFISAIKTEKHFPQPRQDF